MVGVHEKSGEGPGRARGLCRLLCLHCARPAPHRHVLISITFPYGIVTLALVDARYEMPGQTLKVRYWPRDSWPVGLPYVEITGDHKNC